LSTVALTSALHLSGSQPFEHHISRSIVRYFGPQKEEI
jgi:hypothetical protein